MNLLVLPYVLNIMMLLPIAPLTLWGGASGGRRAFQGKFVESEGPRTLLGAIWTAVLIGSFLGLAFPVQMSPLLMLQVIYKSLWLATFALPLLLTGRAGDVPSGIAASFVVIVATYPWVIPWKALFAG